MARTLLQAAGAVGLLALLAANTAQAFNFGNMMNPSRWFNDNDRYYDRYGYGGPYGGPYGGGPWGYGPYGGGWGGYPGYGYGGYPGAIVVTPQSNNQAPAPRVPQ